MNDPRKAKAQVSHGTKPAKFSRRRIAAMCQELEKGFQQNPKTNEAAIRISKSIKSNTNPQSEDLAAVLIEMLHLKVRAREKRNDQRREHRASTRNAQGPKKARPTKTHFSERIRESENGPKVRERRTRSKK